jgi:hypothetical protein
MDLHTAWEPCPDKAARTQGGGYALYPRPVGPSPKPRRAANLLRDRCSCLAGSPDSESEEAQASARGECEGFAGMDKWGGNFLNNRCLRILFRLVGR